MTKSAAVLLARSRMTVLGSPDKTMPVAFCRFVWSCATARRTTSSAQRAASCATSDVAHKCEGSMTLSTSKDESAGQGRAAISFRAA